MQFPVQSNEMRSTLLIFLSLLLIVVSFADNPKQVETSNDEDCVKYDELYVAYVITHTGFLKLQCDSKFS